MGAPPEWTLAPVADGARLDHTVCLAKNRGGSPLFLTPSDKGPWARQRHLGTHPLTATPEPRLLHHDSNSMASKTEPACLPPNLTCISIQVINIYRRKLQLAKLPQV